MKLLFDENLSPKLIGTLAKEYPGSVHVRSAGLRGAEDARIWAYAREHGFTIISKDNDFRQRSFFEGAPPKVIWLEVGNGSTATIAELLRAQHARLLTFETEAESALLVVSISSRAVYSGGHAPPGDEERPKFSPRLTPGFRSRGPWHPRGGPRPWRDNP